MIAKTQFKFATFLSNLGQFENINQKTTVIILRGFHCSKLYNYSYAFFNQVRLCGYVRVRKVRLGGAVGQLSKRLLSYFCRWLKKIRTGRHLGHLFQQKLNLVKGSDFFFQNGDRALRRVGVPVAVDPLADEVFVFPDVAPVVRLVAVAVVAVRAPRTKIASTFNEFYAPRF